MKRINFSIVLVAVVMITMLAGCNGSRSTKEEKIELDEPVKSFLKNSLKSNYSFYTLKSYLPVTMEDLRSNGIYIASYNPEGLFPPNVVNLLYGGGFESGTVVTLDKGSDGIEKFDGIKVMVIIGVSPNGCVEGLREDNEKSIMLFSDDDFKRITKKDSKGLIKIIF